jgi:CheY-like chemotaxis protein
VAYSAGEALQLLASDPEIDAVFSDMMMPGMTGLQLAEAVHCLYPSVKVVLTSGYTVPALMAGQRSYSYAAKPYHGPHARLPVSLQHLRHPRVALGVVDDVRDAELAQADEFGAEVRVAVAADDAGHAVRVVAREGKDPELFVDVGVGAAVRPEEAAQHRRCGLRDVLGATRGRMASSSASRKRCMSSSPSGLESDSGILWW